MKAYGMAGHVIRRLHQLSTHVFSKRMADVGFDLTPVQFAAMDAVIARPGIDQAGIAAAIAYDRATIGGVIDRLEQKGFVERRVCKRDRRAREVRPTKKGLAAFEEILPVVVALQEDILTGLDDTERATFLRLAEKAIGTPPEGQPETPETSKPA
ncbi:MAG: MarR family transcriptional regulator [Hyphomicrobiales bacterium]|nr:MAG: MarR family transcriptional regulator [Hyphomicrobiales bacterium]